MGMIGKRKGSNESVVISNSKTKRQKNNNAHRDLCIKAGRWLMRPHPPAPTCPYVAVEIVTATPETPDVFGWNYWTSVLIEVKMSRSDFLADKKKPFRILPDDGIGEHRYYCCPDGLIKSDELPEKWGLIYEVDGRLEVIKNAERQVANHRAEITICTSIMRREGIKPKLFDYRYNRSIT